MPDKFLFNKPFSKKWILLWIYILGGSFLLACGFVLFITPYNIIPGGVYGIGIILHNFFPNIKVGTFGLFMDIPLLLLAFRLFGAKFGSKTIVAALLTPIMMNALTHFVGENPATMLNGHINLSDDVLLSAIFGGLLIGAGLGLILKTHATSGGTDIIAMIVAKYAKIPFSRSMLIVDSAIVVIGLIVFGDWLLPLYSIVTIYVYVKTIDYMLEGANSDKLIFIISEKHEKIREFILNNLQRGGTYIKSSGIYTGKDKNMIFLVISRKEVSLVKDCLKEVDPEVFMVVVDAHEIVGDGFKNLNNGLR